MTKSNCPILPERIRQHANLPAKLAELSRLDAEKAIFLLRDWGEGKKTIKALWEEITEYVGDTLS
ncbi:MULTISPECIES: hypothetical protein [Lysinibacillus]|uniref:hypothetical protein n=1 Tax=Lysinibacillus TaxID=400634 RepID=UPI0004DB061F|nr:MULTISPECIES: hypothetical protein [Lysinibacillus]AJK88528.1 hypothetical protein HR49_16010 [Lysinibacillus fusiformis]KHK53957.1 hypothetical protein PI85_06985 [Lysinibacillus sp. A1]MEE3809065.1 hypothetical protein [Lysinibacillus fusiformis]